MADPIFLPIERADVISYMGPCWPPRIGEPCVTLPDTSGITDGAVCVYPQEGRPGYLWWVLDNTVYRQDAGVPGEALAELIPGATAGTVPDPNPNPIPDYPPEGPSDFAASS
ncbi:hypothetical protein ACRJ4B_16125 [Streptomyces sp. GTA36]